MKRLFGCMMTVILIVALPIFSDFNPLRLEDCLAADMKPVLALGTPIVKADKKAEVVIMGSGFQPGQEIKLLVTYPDGMKSDIGYALKPEPKPDATGTWSTTWSAGRPVSKKLIPPGPCRITVTDGDYNPIATSVVFFEKAEKNLEYERDLLRNKKIPCNSVLSVRGLQAGEDLVKLADENKIDEIVIGVRRRSKVGKLIFGSTAQYVILNAPCPVVTVK